MKKMMLAVMAAMVIGTTGTALAATPDRGHCWDRDNTTTIETNYAHCGGGYHERGHGWRSDRGERDGYGYGCGGGYGHGGRYCYGYEDGASSGDSEG